MSTQETCEYCEEIKGLNKCQACERLFCEKHFDSIDYGKPDDSYMKWCGRCYDIYADQ